MFKYHITLRTYCKNLPSDCPGKCTCCTLLFIFIIKVLNFHPWLPSEDYNERLEILIKFEKSFCEQPEQVETLCRERVDSLAIIFREKGALFQSILFISKSMRIIFVNQRL